MTEKPQDSLLPLLLLSAWNDSGGGFLGRLFDGHPELYAYPFEMQLGTGLVPDEFEGWFHDKYRWPTFLAPLSDLPSEFIFQSIIDDELKSTITDRASSKFHDFPVAVDMEEWCQSFVDRYAKSEPSYGTVVDAYVRSLFDVWEDRNGSGQERLYFGHCPVVNLDCGRIFVDLPDSRIIHIIRSPFTGFIDMRRRRPEVDIIAYARKWSLVNERAFDSADAAPDKFNLVSLSDLLWDRVSTMKKLAQWVGIEWYPSLCNPTWNTLLMDTLYPFGGLEEANLGYEKHNFEQLTEEEWIILEGETVRVRQILKTAGVDLVTK